MVHLKWISELPLINLEAELCEQRGISRFAAREAVRNLESAELVARQQRVGTVMIATPDDLRYTHDATSLRYLFQHAQNSTLNFVYAGKTAITKA
ncbi:MAG: GntR family transcriptional regulator [Xanthobacteraceae bacterium]|nr:GntR family transcriptional regulator [Xanthobacteraceae bacterium]